MPRWASAPEWAFRKLGCASFSVPFSQVKDLGLGKPLEHETNHGDVDEVLGGVAQGFVVLGEPAVLTDPSQGALHNPALGQHDEALHGVGAFDDLQVPSQPLFDRPDELALISRVPDQLFDVGLLAFELLLEQQERAVSVLNTRWMNDGEEQSEDVYEDVTLAVINPVFPGRTAFLAAS